ncbi:MAG: sigma-70 family RNA polymerase sigma factor [Ruminiclostridium sp.]|nr:sigma-70 family RNA polymerase sigma factor [Ruminiclostridium sp.]
MTGEELEQYILKYRKTVWSAALCYVKNPTDADDIMQDVFLKMFTYDGTFDGEEHIKAWLIRCAINRSKNLLRSHWYKFSAPLEAAMNKLCSDDKEHCQSELPAMFMKLSPKNRVVFYLHYYEGYSIAETARILKISESAVGVRLMRGRKQLEKALNNEGSENNGSQNDR